MNIAYFTKNNNETDERFLLRTEADVIPCIGGRVIFEDFEEVNEYNIYTVVNVDYIYAPNEPKPDIEVILKPYKRA